MARSGLLFGLQSEFNTKLFCWCLSFWEEFPNIAEDNQNVIIAEGITDELRWRHGADGQPKFHDFYDFIQPKSNDDKSFTNHHAFLLLRHCIREADALDSGTIRSCVSNLLILKMFHLTIKVTKARSVVEVQRHAPLPEWIKINTDGAANRAPGPAGCGGILCTYKEFYKGCFSTPLRIRFACDAELMGIILAANLCNSSTKTCSSLSVTPLML
ncbi:hypothetical protein TIFTF001_028743 [Ficus carica]|uniref:RNase H type-1 domain-containing protein n=1 Tax=Ficus carica TaxID=3494 RepID=A0AA88J1I5_FICCA|nr:hypothetical protein TIFTF001_028743 [Ficus carica]